MGVEGTEMMLASRSEPSPPGRPPDRESRFEMIDKILITDFVIRLS